MVAIVYKYGSYEKKCTVIKSSRKTLAINITPEMDILLQVPNDCPVDFIEKTLFKRRIWIKKQLQYFEQFHPMLTPRKYISGETHLYLGRQYRLKVIKNSKEPVKLKNGYFWVGANSPEEVKNKLNTWYKEKAIQKFKERLTFCIKQVPETTMPKLSIRIMKKRWGSVSESGLMTLNTNLIKSPVDCVDYVIMHELCHQKYMNHSKDFWKMLNRVLPEWQKVKLRLEISLASHSGE